MDTTEKISGITKIIKQLDKIEVAAKLSSIAAAKVVQHCQTLRNKLNASYKKSEKIKQLDMKVARVVARRRSFILKKSRQ
jgi:hypothetical protein